MKNNRTSNSLLLGASLMLPVLTQAQEVNTDIENILIIGAKTPIEQAQLAGTYTIINSEQIQQSQAFELTDLLRGMAGISVSQSGGKGSLNEIRLRGSESNHVLVLIDGVEINDQGQGGLANFGNINLENVERIEILKGAQSALWGSGAIGGVISITSKAAGSELAGGLKVEVGENASQRLSADISGQAKSVRYSLAASYFDTDGENISREGDEADGYQNKQVNGQLNWQVTDSSGLQFNVRLLDSRNEFDKYDQATGRPADSEKYTDVKQQSGKLVWHFKPSDSLWQHQLGVQYSQSDNQSFSEGAFDSLSKSDKQRWYWQSHFAYQKKSHANFVIEHVSEDFKQRGSNDFSDPNQDQKNSIDSAILDVLHQFNDKINVSASGRIDNNDIYDNANSYQLGLAYTPTRSIKLFATAGQAVKNPTFTETFGFFPASFIGNEQLKPEQSSSWELGGQFSLASNLTFDLSYYEADLENEIKTVFLPDFTSTPINIDGDSKRKGVELALNAYLGDLTIYASYGYSDTEQLDATNKLQAELRRAKNLASLRFNYSFLANKVNVNVQANYQSKQLDNNFATFPATLVELGGYTLVNAAIAYQITPDVKLTARVENLFDKAHEDVFGYVGQSRAAYVGISYRF